MEEQFIITTKASRYFAELVAKQIPSATIIETERKKFGDGERYFRICIDDWEELSGKRVVIVASTATEEDIVEVCRVGGSVADYGARSIIYAIPFEGYTTMERAVKPGEVVSAKSIARQLSQLPQGDERNKFLFLDLHTSGFRHYFEGQCLSRELYGESVFVEAIKELKLSNFMFASADMSRSAWIATFKKIFGTSMALIDKSRDFETTEVNAVVGDVRGRVVMIYDDMIRSAKSMVKAAEAYLKNGAAEIYAVASHLAFNDAAAIRLLKTSPIVMTVGTNSHPMSQHEEVIGSSQFIVKDVSHLFANAIQKLSGGQT